MSRRVTVYTTPACGPCRRLKREMAEAGIAFVEVDVDRVPRHGSRIEAMTGGYKIVPTVEIESHLLVNPSVKEVVEVLGSVA